MTGSQAFEAVVWDMDGLIFDTERLSLLAWQEGARAIGREIDLPIFQSFIGMNARAIQAKLNAALGHDIDVAELTRAAGVRYDQLIANGAPLKKGARACLQFVAESGAPQALATSSSHRYATLKLEHHDLLRYFDAVVTGDQVSHGKPHPEPYLLAAEKLGATPSRCIAFEDSVNGIQSAHQAGMYTVLVPDMCPHDEASLARVSRQFPSLEEALPFLRQQFAVAKPS